MRNLYIVLLMLCAGMANAQTYSSHYYDSLVYFKVDPAYVSQVPVVTNGIAQDGISPEWKDLVNDFGIIELICPFKTKDARARSMFRITYSSCGQWSALIRKISEFGYVEYAERAPIYYIQAIPSDTGQSQQWFLDVVDAYLAWDICTGDPNVKIAIVDDACRTTHADLSANIWPNPDEIPWNSIDDDLNGFVDDTLGWDAADNDNNPNPPVNLGLWGEIAYTHGTHCSGLAAGVTNNITGIASVSYNVSLIPVKTVKNGAFIPLSIGFPSEGVDYAISAGADIISMSFGGEDSSAFQTLANMIDIAWDQGIVCVAAAGNNGDGSGLGTPNAINYPANFNHVIAVGATDSTDTKAAFSQYGTWIDVVSPGVSMWSTLAHSSPYGFQDGTSMACPLTASVLGLMKSHAPMATAEQLEYCLKAGCDNIDAQNPTFIGQMGAGRVNAYQSLLCLDNLLSIENTDFGSLKLYPNPASEYIVLKTDGRRLTSVIITDLTGREVFTKKCNDSQVYCSLPALPSGLYVVRIMAEQESFTTKFVVK